MALNCINDPVQHVLKTILVPLFVSIILGGWGWGLEGSDQHNKT